MTSSCPPHLQASPTWVYPTHSWQESFSLSGVSLSQPGHTLSLSFSGPHPAVPWHPRSFQASPHCPSQPAPPHLRINPQPSAGLGSSFPDDARVSSCPTQLSPSCLPRMSSFSRLYSSEIPSPFKVPSIAILTRERWEVTSNL